MASVRTTRTVYLPSAPGAAAEFRRSGRLDRGDGISVDEAYARGRDLDPAVPDDEEEADYWALTDAGLAGLAQSEGLRFVIAVRVRPEQIVAAGPDGTGRVTVADVDWSQVSALFIDEAEALPALAAARAVLTDPDLFAERTAALVADHDLLWYAPDELDDLLA